MIRHAGITHIRLTGRMSAEDTRTYMTDARFLVFPSRWYEPFGMALIEAAAAGVPAIATRIAGIPELVIDGKTGLLFDADEPDDLAAKANWAWNHPAETEALGYAARQYCEQNFTAKKNYESLMNIYRNVAHS
jgi:glycosyltransferase involved in cell wall biosynthesis